MHKDEIMQHLSGHSNDMGISQSGAQPHVQTRKTSL